MTRPEYDLAQRIANLESSKRLPLMRKMRDQGLDISVLPIAPYTQTEGIPLSQAQQGIWLTWRLNPESTAYNMCGAFSLLGGLDLQAFSRAVDSLVVRHSILRTYFRMIHDDNVVQVPLPELKGHLVYRDLLIEQTEGRATVKECITEHAQKRFYLEEEPAWRILLLKVDHDVYKLSIVAHHIIADGQSVGLMIRDLASLYEENVSQRNSNLSELPIQFSDYAIWQQDYFSLGGLSGQLEYWKEHLRGAPSSLDLPFDRPRPDVRNGEGAVHTFVLSAEVMAQIRRSGERNNATTFMIITALLNIVLARYSNQNDISIGTPVANRAQPETEDLIGYFINLLVLRSEVDLNATFVDILAAVRSELLTANQHIDCPFELMVSELANQRLANVHPLFQVKCTEQASISDFTSFGDLTISLDDDEVAKVHFDLSLDFSVIGEKVECQFLYATDIFDLSTIKSMADYFIALASRVLEADDKPLLELLPTAGLAIVLGTVDDLDSQDILKYWEKSVIEGVEISAVRSGIEQISYQDLDVQANKLAHQLVGQGVLLGSRVAIYAERSCEFILYLLAVLKAGGTYVPLDPVIPKKRLEFQIKDSGAILLLSQNLLDWNVSIPTLVTGLDYSSHKSQCRAPDVIIHPEQAAYIIYTSGSSGAPKGVVVSHRALSNYVRSIEKRLMLPKTSTNLAMVSTVSADLGHTVLFGAICHGRTLHLLKPDCIADPDAFANYMQEQKIDVLKITPGHLKGLFSAHEPADILPAFSLILGGEACFGSLVDEIKALNPNLNIVNHYGPTETTVGVLARAVEGVDGSSNSLPLGSPLANCNAYILDNDLNLVPKGVTGELYIGGAQLAHGYQNRLSHTAERFIASPFCDGERIYRTGDQVKMLQDGNIVFQGRTDNQVRIRGYRVEPEEVARTLQKISGVSQAHVEVRGDSDGSNRLYGYVVLSKEGRNVSSESLHESLADILPNYMIPDATILLEAFPLTANGKIDKTLLPLPNAELSQAFEAPQGKVEVILAGIWSKVLCVELISRDDRFFALGGDSILSLKVVARARKEGVKLMPKQLLDNKTLKEIAHLIDPSSNEEKMENKLTPLSAKQRKKALLPSYAQERQWFLWQLEPKSTAYHISGALHLQGELNVAVLRESFEALVVRHESLRTVFHADEEGQVTQVIDEEHELNFSFVDVMNEESSTRQQAVQEETKVIQQKPFDLTTGPLLRVRLIKQAENDYVLVVVMHHIISDGWSMQIIVNEFVAQYLARAQGQQPSFKALPIQYADYAAWQRHWMEAGEKARQLDYWRHQLGEEHPVLELPTDHLRQVSGRYSAAHHELALPATLIDQLRRDARSKDVTLFMELLTGFQILLQRYTGQKDIRIGVPIANRHRVETADVVGLFVNTQVLRTCLNWHTSLVDALDQVKESAQGAQTHQDLPFEQLVDALQPERNIGVNPLFQVMYNHQRKDNQALKSLPNLTLESYLLGEQSAQLDLMLNSVETEDGHVGLTFTYAKELFEAETIERMAKHYQVVLEALVQQPDQKVSDIVLLSDQEQRQLGSWSINAEHYNGVQPVHKLIEQQVTAHPNTTALIFDGQQLSYAELNTRANQLAHYLISQGVRAETKVGIAVDRSINMVVGLLGILKAGGAYIPLDPEYPIDRLTYMVKSSDLQILLTQGYLADQIVTSNVEQVILLEKMDFSDQSIHNPNVTLHGDNLAYVIYTSGSTGKPKGVAVTHSALGNFLLHMDHELKVSHQDTLLAVTSLSFDISALEIYLPLISGAQLVVATREDSRNGVLLAQLMAQHKVTVLQCTPASWRLLLAAGWSGTNGQHLLGLCGGEALQADLAEALTGLGVTLWNMYGPTETTIWSAMSLVEGRVKLGKAIASTELRVLDGALNSVPIGVAGELYIGGSGLARGYLGQEAQSSERFIANPFVTNGGRLYRTGDLVRWSQAGQLEYLGRIDHQVKVRGFRIELGEIEEQLLAQECVSEAVVVAKESASGTQLVGYVSSQNIALVDSASLSNQLRKTLPDYMIPNIIMMLERLPLNGSGKVDRNALPEPDFASLSTYEAPQGEMEIVLAEIWSEVLGVKKIGRNDSFFELGGNSLAVLKVNALLIQKSGHEIPIKTFFEARTVAELACSLPIDTLASHETEKKNRLAAMDMMLQEFGV